jgi:poly(hydroxyalkanoate) depolymerase family esterase
MKVFNKLKMLKISSLTSERQLKKSINMLHLLLNNSVGMAKKLSSLSEVVVKTATKKPKDLLTNKKTNIGGKVIELKKSKTEINKKQTQKQGINFEEHSFSNAAGSRNYKLYIPTSYIGKAVPLMVMMHGCTQSPDDFALGTQMNALAEEMNFIVAYPEQTKSANISKCWNWFNSKDQKKNSGEPSIIAGITHKIIENYEIDVNRVYIAGLSAGGAASAVMGAEYPDLYTAIGVHSGLASGAANSIITAMSAMRKGAIAAKLANSRRFVPAIVFHGDNDNTVSPLNGQQVIDQFKGKKDLKSNIKKTVSSGGATCTITTHIDKNKNVLLEHWVLHGVGHAWSGGSNKGSYTDSKGPNASREMMRFFLSHAK